MDSIFPLEKKFCKIFKENNNPELSLTKLPNYVSSSISKLSLQFAKETYYKLRLCFLHNKTDHLFYFNYPNIEVVDDYGLLFLLKLYKLYEMEGKKIADYHSSKDSVVLFNKTVKMDRLYKYLFILSVLDGKKYNINFTNEDNILLLSIKGSFELDYLDEIAKNNIFNRYLRESIETDEFYKKYVVGKKRNEIEKEVGKYFKKLKKDDPDFLKNTREIFDLQYNNLIEKLDNFYKTEEYKNSRKV